MALFSASQIDKINQVAAKSKEVLATPTKPKKAASINAELNSISKKVEDYFKDSPAILITSPEQLHDYVTECINVGYIGIDTETTGLDRIRDTIVGASLYYPGGHECYIPCKHLIPIFDEPYKGQLTYQEVGQEFQRLIDSKVKCIFANADFDIAMMYKDFKTDFSDVAYFDVISAWRCLKENEKDNALKVLYNKYPLKGKGDPMKFSDFFSPSLFPYCKPEIAKLYAANDAKITYELFMWQLPYCTKSSAKCEKHHLERIADLIWNIEMPMIKQCAMLHRAGVYLDKDVSAVLHERYSKQYDEAVAKLHILVQELIDQKDIPNNSKRPFRLGRDFNPSSPVHVKYLLNNLLGVEASSTGKEVLEAVDAPATNQILKVRQIVKLMSTYVDKLPKVVAPDGRIHATFRSIGADTGRMSSADPNMQNIPSHAVDIRHMFRATAANDYVVDSTENENNEVEFVIDNGHQVYTPDGLVFVSDLKIGDVVYLQENGKEINSNVKKITIEGASTRICYDVI